MSFLGNKKSTSRMSFTLPDTTKEVLEKLAEEKQMSVSALIQEMVTQELVLEAMVQQGAEVRLFDANGKQITVLNKKSTSLAEYFSNALLSGNVFKSENGEDK